MKTCWPIAILVIALASLALLSCSPGDENDDPTETDDDLGDDDIGDNDAGDDDDTSPDSDDDASPSTDDDDNDTLGDDDDADSLRITLVDGGKCGSSTSLALLPGGEVAIATQRGGMPYLYRFAQDGPIAETALDPQARSAHSALIADPQGNLHLLYTDDFSHSLVYLTNRKGEWEDEVLLTAEDLDAWIKPDLVLDADGFLHAAFVRGMQLYYATNRDGAWRIELVPSFYADIALDLVVDEEGSAHLAFYGGLDGPTDEMVLYATNAGGDWSVESVVNNPQIHAYESQAAIALDSRGRPHVVFCSQAYYGIVYATREADGWVVEEPYGDFVSNLSLSFLLDQEDHPHLTIGSTATIPAGLYYLTRRDVDWETQTLYNAPWAGFISYDTSLAMDDEGILHLSLFLNNSLMYAVKAPGQEWTMTPVADYGELISNVTMAMDRFGHFHLTYVRDSGAGWRYAFFDGSQWRYETIRKNVGRWGEVGIALDPDGFAHAVYAAQSDYSLLYATNKSGAWVVSDLLPQDARQEKSYYLHPVIAADGAGFIHVAFTPSFDSRLVYFTNQSGEWRQIEVDNTGMDMTVADKAIALDQAGAVHIAYMVYHQMSYFLPWLTGLKYATNQTGEWQTQWLSPAFLGGWNPQLVALPDGRVFISHASGLQWMKLLEIDGENISSTQVASTEIEYTAMAVDEEGAPHLGGTGQGRLWYFFQDGETWQSRLIDANYLAEDNISSMALDDQSVYFAYAHTRAVWLAAFPKGNGAPPSRPR